MDVIVDSNLCVGCGLCEENLPEVFIMRNQKAEVITSEARKADEDQLIHMIDDCPAEAIQKTDSDE